MSQSELDQLVDQLYVEDAKVRRNAAKRLGESGQPEYIAELVNVYMKDADAGVRKTAEDALRGFRRIEQNMLQGADPDQAPQRDLAPLLSRLRLILGLLLVITFFINGVILIGRAIPPPAVVAPTQAGPSVRSALVDGLDKRIKQASDDAATLRKLFSTIQGGMGLQGVKQDQCQALQNEPLDAVDFGSADSIYYPDLKQVSDLLNIATPKIAVVRNDYLKLCAAKTQQDFDGQVTALGGAGAEVKAIDDATNQYLSDASLHLKKAIANPAPTITLTFTPTPTLTPTVPTATPTFTPSTTPTAGPTSSPTSAATGAATSAGTQQAAVADTYTFTGLMLDGLTSYKYRAQASTSGTLTTNKVFRGSMQLSAQRQTNPIEADYDVNVNEGLANITFFKPYLGGMYVSGVSNFTVVGDTLYETGSVLDVPKFNGRCRITKLAANTMPSKVQDLTLADLNGFVVKATSTDLSMVNGVDVLHYKGERNIGDSKEFKQTLDMYVSADKHIPISLTETQVLDPTVKNKSGLKDYSFTLTYDLTGSAIALDIIKPLACETTK